MTIRAMYRLIDSPASPSLPYLLACCPCHSDPMQHKRRCWGKTADPPLLLPAAGILDRWPNDTSVELVGLASFNLLPLPHLDGAFMIAALLETLSGRAPYRRQEQLDLTRGLLSLENGK